MWPSRIWKYTERTISGPGICTARVTNWRCMRGVMLKEPAVGFMQAVYCELIISLRTILTLSYLQHRQGHKGQESGERCRQRRLR